MSQDWPLVPLSTLGPLRLGMTVREVEALADLLGAVYALDRKELPSGEIVFRESRDLEAPIVTYKNDQVIEIMTDHHSRFNVVHDSLPVFDARAADLRAALERRDGSAWWGFGGVVFPKLSIGTMNFLTGFAPDGSMLFWGETAERPPRSVTLAMPGAFDPFLDRHDRPISFL